MHLNFVRQETSLRELWMTLLGKTSVWRSIRCCLGFRKVLRIGAEEENYTSLRLVHESWFMLWINLEFYECSHNSGLCYACMLYVDPWDDAWNVMHGQWVWWVNRYEYQWNWTLKLSYHTRTGFKKENFKTRIGLWKC